MHGFYMLWPKFLPWLNVRFSKCPSEDEKERERERERERQDTVPVSRVSLQIISVSYAMGVSKCAAH